MEIQVFRRRGIIICVKVGWIAVDIPYQLKIRKAEVRGIGNHSYGNSCYYDIALNGLCFLHILKCSRDLNCQPFFFDVYPF